MSEEATCSQRQPNCTHQCKLAMMSQNDVEIGGIHPTCCPSTSFREGHDAFVGKTLCGQK